MKPLKFIALSGTIDVTENLYVYEYGNDMIIVDCGIGFPESEMYGVDLVIPDFSYIKENRNKLRGILISHGHEDHFGALPFLLKEVQAPVYATKLVAGFIKDKLSDYKIKRAEVNVIDPEKDVLSLGAFRVKMFRVSHSVPDGVGFAIDTPEGSIFHVADYKFDWTPVDEKPFDLAKAATLASQGVLAVASDCLGSTTPGHTQSEKEIERQIEQIAMGAKGQIFFTTISSNISRMQQAINVAARMNRKVAFIGRSTEAKAQIAKNLGYLHYSSNLVIPPKKAGKLSKNRVMYIISGSYGQPGSALYRLANGEHKFLSLDGGDTVIFSSDPAPPGSKANVDGVVDRLIELGVDVHYYEMQEDLHVSGHGSQEDIKMLFALLNPKYFIPIGGTIRHMRAYKDIAVNMGADPRSVFELMPGDIIEFKEGKAAPAGRIDVKSVLVDGLGIGDVGKVVLRDRQRLAQDGVAIVLLQVDKRGQKLISDPEVISRGFVFEKKKKGFLIQASKLLSGEIRKRNRVDKHVARNVTVDFLERFFFKQTGRRPMILPVVVEV
ncbi:MAG: ribonuclease J [Microgenomates group bacterium]